MIFLPCESILVNTCYPDIWLSGLEFKEVEGRKTPSSFFSPAFPFAATQGDVTSMVGRCVHGLIIRILVNARALSLWVTWEMTPLHCRLW